MEYTRRETALLHDLNDTSTTERNAASAATFRLCLVVLRARLGDDYQPVKIRECPRRCENAGPDSP